MRKIPEKGESEGQRRAGLRGEGLGCEMRAGAGKPLTVTGLSLGRAPTTRRSWRTTSRRPS